jgi:hypothetical protein
MKSTLQVQVYIDQSVFRILTLPLIMGPICDMLFPRIRYEEKTIVDPGEAQRLKKAMDKGDKVLETARAAKVYIFTTS